MNIETTVLLVEDDEHLAASLLASFDDEGYVVDHASTWEHGLGLFRVTGHSLVIADYTLPGSDHGLKLLAAIRQLVPSSRLVLVSGAMSPAAQRIAQEVELVDAFYTKTHDLADKLLYEIQITRGSETQPTDWKAFGSGFLTEPSVQLAALEKVNEALRTDVERKPNG